MRRGDLITVAMPGAYSKPRPAVVIQVTRIEELESVTFLPLSSTRLPEQVFRVTVFPNSRNGLRKPSQVMADKCSTLPVEKVGPVFGRLSDDDMAAVNRALAIFLGFV
jgi:mRNA interferase MazF